MNTQSTINEKLKHIDEQHEITNHVEMQNDFLKFIEDHQNASIKANLRDKETTDRPKQKRLSLPTEVKSAKQFSIDDDKDDDTIDIYTSRTENIIGDDEEAEFKTELKKYMQRSSRRMSSMPDQHNKCFVNYRASFDKAISNVLLSDLMAKKQVDEDKTPSSMDDKCAKSLDVPTRSKFPISVILVVLSELCERFSYFGINTILIIYLKNYLDLSENTSTALYHGFATLCYITPVLGAIIADSYIGQYKTIVYFTIVYFLGEFLLTFMSVGAVFKPNLAVTIIGLLLIAIGDGCISSCVSAFGAKQFASDQVHYVDRYFSAYFFIYNLGALIGIIVTPILRNDVKCFNGDCYMFAFAVPTLFMLLSLVLFVCGTTMYKAEEKPTENLFKNVAHCICHALKAKFKNYKEEKNVLTGKSNWLDYSHDKFDVQFVDDVKCIVKVVCMFIPVPVFWALFEQQHTRWTLQASKLNTYVTSDYSYALKPEQIQVVNPLMMIVLIPVFDYVIYPLLGKFNLLQKDLSRMAFGMFLGFIAFVFSAMLELKIQHSYVSHNLNSQIGFVNLVPCKLNLITHNRTIEIKYGEQYAMPYEDIDHDRIEFKCANSTKPALFIVNPKTNTKSYKNYYVAYGNASGNLDFNNIQSSLVKRPVGLSEVRFYSLVNGINKIHVNSDHVHFDFKMEPLLANVNSTSNYNLIDSGIYALAMVTDLKAIFSLNSTYMVLNGARYTFITFNNTLTNKVDIIELVDLQEYKISIVYQLVPYFFITTGEIMFSVSGLVFAYSQAPNSMKSIFQAVWLLTQGYGNLLVAIIAESHLVHDQFYEYVLFAGLMLLTTIIFIWISYAYKEPTKSTGNKDKEAEKYVQFQ
jgi:dipeptide/tripeptide permease